MTFWIDLLCNENIVPLLCFVLTNWSLQYFACDYNCPINASLFDSGVCALVFFSLWESTFCIACLRNVCRLHAHVGSYEDACLCMCVTVCRYARLFIDIVNHYLPERLLTRTNSRMRVCLPSSLSDCVALLVSFVCTTPGILMASYYSICQCMALCVNRCVQVSARASRLYMYSCLYGALLQLDWICCTINALFYRLCDEYSI